MIFGVDYYPEHWDEETHRHNLELMAEGGFNTVRMAEFAWKLMEPSEGKFDFSWLDKAIDDMGEKNIDVILGTPTAAPPTWLVKKYDVLMRDKYGRPRGYGARRACCANNPDYIRLSAAVTEKMARHFAGNKNVIAWQIDNEFGCHNSTLCYCEHCRKAFSHWLQKRYKNIDDLNKKWGTVFWSMQYDNFDDVILPAYNSCEGDYGNLWSHNPSLDLEFRRFASDSWVKYQRMQIDIIRKYTDKPITHNLMGHFSDLDYYDLSKDLDVVSWDNYPDNQWGDSEYEYVSMAHEIMRGVKDKNFWVMEEQAGPAGWDIVGSTPKPGQLRLWVYQAIAHGASGIVFFRFRTALFGMEQYWYGVLDHDGIPNRRYKELQALGKELQPLSKLIENGETCHEVMIFKSYDNNWANAIKRHAKNFNYENLLYDYFRANTKQNITTAIGCGNFEKYKAVYMPAYNVTDMQTVYDIEQYVQNGGILVLTFRSGIRDEFNNMLPLTVPGVFRELAGIRVSEFDALRQPVKVTGAFEGNASIWCDIVEPETAQVLCTYKDTWFAGNAAVTVNKFGNGFVYYVGCDLDETAMDSLIGLIADKHELKKLAPNADSGVEVVSRTYNNSDYLILMNHNSYAASTGVNGTSLIDGQIFDGTLPPYGVEIIKQN